MSGPAHGNLRVAGLPDGFDESGLRQLFDGYGTIGSCKVIPSKNLGYVRFASPGEAQMVIDSVNGTTFGAAVLSVEFATGADEQGEACEGPGAAWRSITETSEEELGPGAATWQGISVAGDEELRRGAATWHGISAAGEEELGPGASWRRGVSGGDEDWAPGAPSAARGESSGGEDWRPLAGPATPWRKVGVEDWVPGASWRKGAEEDWGPGASWRNDGSLDQDLSSSRGAPGWGAPGAAEQRVDQVYIKGLPSDYTDEALRSTFSGYGNIVWSKVLGSTGRPDCAALVQFSSADEASWLVENLNNNIPHGLTNPVMVQLSKNKGKAKGKSKEGKRGFSPYDGDKGGKGASVSNGVKAFCEGKVPGPRPGFATGGDESNLYVKGLPAHADDLYLYRLFSPFGAIQSVKAVTGEGWATGFVKFSKDADAQGAIKSLTDQALPDGSYIQISVKTKC